MSRFGMRVAGWTAGFLVAAGLMAMPGTTVAQDTASVHGHVQNAIGMPLTSGDVKLTTDRTSDAKSRKYEYSFPIDGSGNYKGDGIKPGKYTVVAFQGTVSVDFMLDQPFAAGENKEVDFDMTRKEYIDKMTPEEKAAMEETKKKNAAAMSANAKIANLNNLLKDAPSDIAAQNLDAAIKAMTDATTAKPDEAILWITLGDAQLGQATAADKAAHASHATDASLPDKYATALASYQKALGLNGAAAKPNADLTAAANNQIGQIYGKLGKPKEASDAYELAAKTDPPKAGMYFFNEAATLYNSQDMDDAAIAADKAIAADPTKAQAYYIKGQSLIQKAAVDPKTNKITVPPGCVEAYQKFLELVPTGPQADEVKGILTGIGASVQSTYKAPGKK